MTHRFKCEWKKWRASTGILYDQGVPLKLKGTFYWTTIGQHNVGLLERIIVEPSPIEKWAYFGG